MWRAALKIIDIKSPCLLASWNISIKGYFFNYLVTPRYSLY